MTPTEEWRAVSGYAGAYEVSNLGRVRSLLSDCIMAIHRGDRYSKVRLAMSGSGSTKNVHALVAAAFIGPRPDGLEVCHNNGDHHDNRVENLRYDTHQSNQLDLVRHGRHAEARRTHCDHGHEFTPENTIPRTGKGESGRRCLTCDRARGKRRWQEELSRRDEAV